MSLTIDSAAKGIIPSKLPATTSSALNQQIGKVVFWLNGGGNIGAIACTDSRLACPNNNYSHKPRWQVEVWKFDPEPKCLYTVGNQEDDQFGPLLELQGKLLIPYLNHYVEAWSLETGLRFPLPEPYKIIDQLSTSDKFYAHINKGYPGRIHLSDPKTFELLKVITIDSDTTFDMIITRDKIIHIGLMANKLGKLTVYKDPLHSDESITTHFYYDGFGHWMYVLDEANGMIFNHVWAGSTNQIWDANTLDVIMHCAFLEPLNLNFTETIDRFAANASSESIRIYERTNPIGKMDLLHTIELFGPSNILCSFTAIPYSDRFFACGGFRDGKVILWDIQSGAKFAELLPLEGMQMVKSLQMAGDKLLVAYFGYSNDNTLAICWDIKQRQPFLKITRDKPQGDNEPPDDVFFDATTGNIIARTGNEVMVYEKFAPPSDKPKAKPTRLEFSATVGHCTVNKIRQLMENKLTS